MDLYLALSVLMWAVGGVFCTAWLFWLDRDRREIAFPLKAATLVLWPVSFPVLLHERGDLTGWEAGRNALVWLSLVLPGLGLGLQDRLAAPGGGRETQYVVVPLPASPVPIPSRRHVITISQPAQAGVPSENDKREAIRYWNSGIISYQRGDYEKARDEWQACSRLDPGNGDCTVGLNRIDQSYGSLVSAVR